MHLIKKWDGRVIVKIKVVQEELFMEFIIQRLVLEKQFVEIGMGQRLSLVVLVINLEDQKILEVHHQSRNDQ